MALPSGHPHFTLANRKTVSRPALNRAILHLGIAEQDWLGAVTVIGSRRPSRDAQEGRPVNCRLEPNRPPSDAASRHKRDSLSGAFVNNSS